MADIDGELYVRTNGDVDDKVQSKIVDFTTPTQGMEVDADNDAHVKAKLRDDSGAAFGIESNPVFVTETEDPSPTVHDYDKAVAVAADGTATHTFSPTNSTRVYSILLSSSGYAKYEISYGTTASEVEKFVIFTEPSSRTFNLELPKPIILAGGTDSLVITKTNYDNKAKDIYSTVVGQEF
jgi:hypothetical protein